MCATWSWLRGDFSCLNSKQTVVVLCVCKNAVKVLAVGVSNENLSECFVVGELYDLFDASGIEFVEYVVEQQQWGGVAACLP